MFEPGSSFHQNLFTQAKGGFVWRSFRWNGRNSYKERLAASTDFVSYLRIAIESHPLAKHIIIAHSHGGTIAARALIEAFGTLPEGSLAHFICLATPFAYVVPATN